MSNQAILALAIFITAYIFMASEKIHRTILVIFGSSAMIILGVFKEPLMVYARYVDFNTIFLLIGMMTFVSVIKRSGLFEFLGAVSLRLARGSVVRLYLYLVTVVALTSSVLDNVTTIMVIMPITFAVCDTIDIDPLPFVLGEIFSSNIGGTATLIGDPPNIMIGSANGLTFVDFFLNLGPVVLVIFIVINLIMLLIFKKKLFLKIDPEKIENLHEKRTIPDKRRFRISVGLTMAVVALFILQHTLHLESATIALLMAALAILLLERNNLEKILEEVEWATILFFIGLFIMVGGLEETGLLETFSSFMIKLSGGSYLLTKLLVLNISGIASSFVDNIPYTATMIPVIKSMQKLNPVTFSNLRPIWWSLSLGSCLGGNGTAIGASANVIGLAIMKRYYGKEMGFTDFMKYGLFVLVVSLIISSAYVVFIL